STRRPPCDGLHGHRSTAGAPALRADMVVDYRSQCLKDDYAGETLVHIAARSSRIPSPAGAPSASTTASVLQRTILAHNLGAQSWRTILARGLQWSVRYSYAEPATGKPATAPTESEASHGIPRSPRRGARARHLPLAIYQPPRCVGARPPPRRCPR